MLKINTKNLHFFWDNTIDNSIIRSYKSDIDRHILTKSHIDALSSKKNNIDIIKFFPNRKNKELDPNQIFNINFLIHMINNDIPITKVDSIFTEKFINDLLDKKMAKLRYMSLKKKS